jgi:hypothetical protein
MKLSAKDAFALIAEDLFKDDEDIQEKFDNEETLKQMVALVKLWFDEYGKHKITTEKEHNYAVRELGLKLSTIKPNKADREVKRKKMNISKAERDRRRARMKEFWAKKKGEKSETNEINKTLADPVPDEAKTTKKKTSVKK